MRKVITYGTYDFLHQGHINLLKRAKALGDYLIVGVTNDNFDRERGKLNVQNNVLERVEAVKATGLADKIIIEDYFGQKIDDIQRYDIDVFAIGSDWVGKFDYLREYCEVVYLPRTEGVSSTMLRAAMQKVIKIGIVGAGRIAKRFIPESKYVSAVKVCGIYDIVRAHSELLVGSNDDITIYDDYFTLLDSVDAVYIATPHLSHFDLAVEALKRHKHVLIETPMVLSDDQAKLLYDMAESNGVIAMEASKTAHCPAFSHLMSMITSGVIGDVVDVEASLSKLMSDKSLREFDPNQAGGSMFELASYPLLPIIKLFGCDYKDLRFCSLFDGGVDVFTKGTVLYSYGSASFKLGLGVKTEGNLVISGTKGYAYVPAPWWKTDYFELRYEDQNLNKKFFYKWDESGLRYEIQEFISCIVNHRFSTSRLRRRESVAIAGIMKAFRERNNVTEIMLQ